MQRRMMPSHDCSHDSWLVSRCLFELVGRRPPPRRSHDRWRQMGQRSGSEASDVRSNRRDHSRDDTAVSHDNRNAGPDSVRRALQSPQRPPQLVPGFGDPNCVRKARSRLSQPLLLQVAASPANGAPGPAGLYVAGLRGRIAHPMKLLVLAPLLVGVLGAAPQRPAPVVPVRIDSRAESGGIRRSRRPRRTSISATNRWSPNGSPEYVARRNSASRPPPDSARSLSFQSLPTPIPPSPSVSVICDG